jgi:dTDP-4-dehydrorhamnose reductase
MLVHYSTDYVFDGSKAGSYDEFDEPAPLNVYGASKLAGERAVAAAGGRYLVLRTSWIYGPGGNNFLLTVRRLAREREELRIVDDQVGSPTSSLQLAHATARIVREWATASPSDFPAGLDHATAGGSVSWCGFAQAIVEALIRNPQVHTSLANTGKAEGEAERGTPFRLQRIVPVSSAEYPTPARRPLNSVLCNFKFERTFGFCLANWELGLAEVVRELRWREGGAGSRDDAHGSGSWNPGPARNLA